MQEVAESVRSAYLTDAALQRIASQLKVAVKTDGSLDKDVYNEAVKDAAARILAGAAMRAGNLKNVTMGCLRLAKKIQENGKAFCVIPVSKHKVAKSRQLKLVVDSHEYEAIIVPLMAAAAYRCGGTATLKSQLFVTYSGAPIRKSSFIFGYVNRGRSKAQKISANILRHCSVSLFARGRRSGMSAKDHATLLLHSEKQAKRGYEILTDEDAVELVAKYRSSMYSL